MVGCYRETNGDMFDVVVLRMTTWASQELNNGKPMERNNVVGFIRRHDSSVSGYDLWVRLFSCYTGALPCSHGINTLTAATQLRNAFSWEVYIANVKHPLPPPHGSRLVQLSELGPVKDNSKTLPIKEGVDGQPLSGRLGSKIFGKCRVSVLSRYYYLVAGVR